MIHTHHYNVALVRALLSAERMEAARLIEGTVAELAFQALRYGGGGAPDQESGRPDAVSLFTEMGLGMVEPSDGIDGGGELRVSHSHFAVAWLEKYGRARVPVCSVVAGFVSGALSAIHSRAYEVVETQCRAQGKPVCRFRVTPGAGQPRFSLLEPSGAPEPRQAPLAPGGSAPAVVVALGGGSDAGPITPAADLYGGAVTRLWADFYARVSFGFEREYPRVMGSKFASLPALVLVEAGHSAAYHTFGRIMRSPHWREAVMPLLSTREDWLAAAMAVVNSLGWGTWSMQDLRPGERAVIRVQDSYEAVGHHDNFGLADSPKCYFARGAAAALMNLVYVGNIHAAPELTTAHFNHAFRSPFSFRAVETRCRARGDAECEFAVSPLSPGLAGRFFEEL